MSKIKERLDQLRDLIQTDEYLTGKGLSYEVNIRFFCYEVQDEPAVKAFIQQLTSDRSLSCRVIEKDLYQIFLDACTDMDILDAIPEMEASEGQDFLLDELHNAIGEEEYVSRMTYSPHQAGDVLMLTGVGDVFPFMRVHALLEAMQPHFPDVPILVMYPGKFDGSTLRLFDKLPPNSYYRAFNVV